VALTNRMRPLVQANWRTPAVVLTCGGLVLLLALGTRHGFGLFLQPITMERGWGRETFAFALALQNLVWGVAQPFSGMLADKYGTGRVVLAGAVLYAAGLVVMALAGTPWGFSAGAGVLIGLGLSGTTFSVVFGAIGRTFPPEKRSLALGTAGAMGSFGMFVMLPLEQTLISGFGWLPALLILAAAAAIIAPLSAALAEPRDALMAQTQQQSVREAIVEAFGQKSFNLLTLGFFVCGFQVVFISVHFPAYLLDRGLPVETGVAGLALIGFCNVIGSYAAGWLGARWSKKYLLSALYLGRSVAIALFLLAPLAPISVYLFSAAIGLLWLGTVPLTNGIVAQVFGVRYFAMLGGFVFFSHQIGSFLGAWLGGYLFDTTGSYETMWLISIALGVVAAIANLPIDERPLARAPRPVPS
jgi:MFS family permease